MRRSGAPRTRRAAPHVAFLRGVNNIGMTRRVSMAELRGLFEDLGFRDVRTLLNSGTVVFSSTAKKLVGARARIEKAIARELGVGPRVTLLSRAEIASAVRDNPFTAAASDASRSLIVVLSDPADRERLEPLLEERWAPEKLAVGRRVAYLWCARGVAASLLWPRVDHALGRSGTARNMRTMTKLLAMMGTPSPRKLR